MSQSTNQTFSLSRFGRLFGRHTAEHLPRYLMTGAVGAGAMILIMGFVTYLQRTSLLPAGQEVFFVLFLVAGGSFFASSVFAHLGEKRQATVALLLPASHLEKYLVAWLYSLPLFLVVFVPLFYLADVAVAYAGAAPGQTPQLLNIFADVQHLASLFWTLALVHAVWLWGAIYFEKTHFIKTAFLLFGIMGALSLINFRVLKAMLGTELRPAPPFTSLTVMEGPNYFHLGLPEAQSAWLGLVPVVLAGLLWLAAYYRVTEKQL